jgi:hypothetical protein
MLNELVKRLGGGGKADRRGAKRVRKRYPMAWIKDGVPVSGVGLEISEKGLLFASRETPPAGPVDVAIDINGKEVRARLKVARQGTLERDGAHWALIAAIFEAIGADDWDAVVRFCRNRGTAPNRAVDELHAKAGQDDDAYRLLPLRVQERVVAALVAAGRLAPATDPKNPLLRITSCTARAGGAFEVVVHSRRVDDEELLAFDSTLSVDDAGNVKLKH